MVGTSNLGSWNDHWLYTVLNYVANSCQLVQNFATIHRGFVYVLTFLELTLAWLNQEASWLFHTRPWQRVSWRFCTTRRNITYQYIIYIHMQSHIHMHIYIYIYTYLCYTFYMLVHTCACIHTYHAIPYHTMPCHAMCHAMPYQLHYITLHGITLHHIALRYITLHCITSHHIATHHTSHHITSHYITLQHITSHHITSHHITLHHITSHHTTSSHTGIYFHTFPNSLHFTPGLALVPLGPNNWSLPPMGLAVAVAVAATPILVLLSEDGGWDSGTSSWHGIRNWMWGKG